MRGQLTQRLVHQRQQPADGVRIAVLEGVQNLSDADYEAVGGSSRLGSIFLFSPPATEKMASRGSRGTAMSPPGRRTTRRNASTDADLPTPTRSGDALDYSGFGLGVQPAGPVIRIRRVAHSFGHPVGGVAPPGIDKAAS